MIGRIRELWSRAVAQVRGAQRDRDFRDELAAHVEMATAHEIDRGTDPVEARRLALVRLGGLDATRARRSENRGFMAIELMWRDIRYAARTLRRSPGYSFAVVLILGAGIGVTTAVFSVLKAVLLQPLPYARPTELVTIWESNLRTPGSRDLVAGDNLLDWQERATTLQDVAGVSRWNGNLTGLKEPYHVGVAYATPSLWTLFGVAPAAGRLFAAAEPDEPENGTRTVVISYGLWQRAFGGDDSAVGRVMIVNDHRFRVVGVAPGEFRFPDSDTDIWVREDLRRGSRDYHHLAAIGRLRHDVSIGQAQRELEAIAAALAREFPSTNADRGVKVLSLQDEHRGDIAPSLLLLQGAVALVLLITCVNASNLMTCRAQLRIREHATRRALGVSRRGLTQTVLTESLLLALTAGGVGVLLAWVVTSHLGRGLSEVLPEGIVIVPDWMVFAFALCVSLLVGVACSLAPVLHGLSIDPVGALKSGGHGASGSRAEHRWQRGLVIGQVALSTLLLLSALALLRSLVNLQHTNLGFNPQAVVTGEVSLPASRYAPGALLQFYEDLRSRLRSIPGVISASVASPIPLTTTDDLVEVRVPSTPGRVISASLRVVGPDFFQTLQIGVLAGRAIATRDRPGAPAVAVVSRLLASQLWMDAVALGQKVRVSGVTCEVVGVVDDIRGTTPAMPPVPTVYLPLGQEFREFPAILVRTSLSSADAVVLVKNAIRGMDRDVPLFHIRDLTDAFASFLAPRRVATALLAALAALATLLAGSGVFALLSYIVWRRHRDTAIRLALGAPGRQILASVVRDGMRLVLIGLMSGLLLAAASLRMLNRWLIATTATDPGTVVGVIVILTLVGLAASCFPARRALLRDPIRALGTD